MQKIAIVAVLIKSFIRDRDQRHLSSMSRKNYHVTLCKAVNELVNSLIH